MPTSIEASTSGAPVLEESGKLVLDSAAWISSQHLLLVGHCDSGVMPTRAPTDLSIKGARRSSGGHGDGPSREEHMPTRAGTLAGSPTIAGGSCGHGTEVLALDERRVVVLVRLLDSALATQGPLQLSLGASELTHAELSAVTTDLQSLLRRHFTSLDPATRHRIIDFIASVPHGDAPANVIYELAQNQRTVCEALRERLPQSCPKSDQPLGVSIEAMFALDDRSFYLRGWVRDNLARPARLALISPQGKYHELLGREFHFPRPDIDQLYGPADGDELRSRAGILCFFQSDVPCCAQTGWIAQVESKAGLAIEIEVPRVIRDPLAARDALLTDILSERLDRDELLPNHIQPAIERLQKRHAATLGIEMVRQFGDPPADPAVSIITPLYKRIDFVEQQLAQYANDPEIRQADLIFVLDSPELAPALLQSAQPLYQLYRVPFRIAVMKTNGGFSAVNNFGATLARAPLLLLLNPDILPVAPGWLGRMMEIHRSFPRGGSLGAKLLYEDDSLQHAGMYFSRHPASGLWTNEHYFKGLHRSLPQANVARAVPALTAACLMIRRDLYESIGGLSGEYVQGDYEDSDLSLRLIEAGYENWYTPEVELYHLEGQSYPAPLRQMTTRFNRWLHTRRWSARIEEVMNRFGQAPANPM